MQWLLGGNRDQITESIVSASSMSGGREGCDG